VEIVDNKIIVFIIAAAILAASLGYITPGAFFSSGTIESISKTTLNGKDAFLVTLLGGSGADGLAAEISKDRFPTWNADKSLTVGIKKADDRYVYRLTERSSSTKTINSLKIVKECQGNNPLDSNACTGINQPWTDFSSFKSYCRSLNPNGIVVSTGTIPVPLVWDSGYHWRCYAPDTTWVVADFNRVGGIYEPKVYVDALTYQRGTQPWINSGQNYEKIAQVELSRSNPSGILVTDTGENLGQATITGMSPLFTTPPSDTAIKAMSAPTTPRSFRLVDGSIDTDAQTVINQFSTCQMNARIDSGQKGGLVLFGIVSIPVYEDYTESAWTSCVNTYNSNVAALANNNPPVGDFARSDIGLDTSSINSNGTISIKNSFALPHLTIWIYAESVGVTRMNAIPLAITCQNKQLDGGVSDSLKATITNSPLGAGILYWTASCTTPVTVSQASGQVNANIAQSINFDVPISTGSQQGVSICTLQGKSTDLQNTVTGQCSVNVKAACNTQVPAGCHLDAGCILNCTIAPAICTDGTKVGDCNFLKTQRCFNQGGTLNLVQDASCKDTPSAGNGTALVCLPYIQKVSTATVGGLNIPFLGNIGGTAQQSCVWDFTILGIALLAGAALLFKMGRGQEAKAVGIAGLALLILSFVADNATLLALGGAGIFAIAAVVAVAYIVLRFGLI
jgi:hypothetical protein